MKYTKQFKTKKLAMFIFLLCFFGVFVCGQEAQAAKSCSSVISYPGKTSARVNIRKKAGTKYKSYGLLNSGQDVTILGEVKNGSMKWFKCRTKINGKNKTGYVAAGYISRTFPQKGYVNSKIVTHLNVRKSKKSSAKSLAQLKSGTELTIHSITKKSKIYWYKVSVVVNGKKITGYVSGKYVSVGSAPKQTTQATTEKKPATTQESTKIGYVNDKVSTTLRVRQEASTSSAILMHIPPKTEVIILGTTGSWYKVRVTYGGKTVTGYVASEYITIKTTTENKTETATTETKPEKVQTEAEFEASMKGFPADYQTSLRALHKSYPKWRFVAIQTGLDWNTVISNESVVGRNVIQSNYPKGTATLAPFSYLSTASGAYKWNTDTYIVKDGSNWYSANPAVISYYMDPRNFLNANDIFQYEALAYDESQSENVVQSILNNTFMKGNYSVTDKTTGKKVTGAYKTAFMDAGKNAKANPYFLATRVKQEVGVNGSNSTSGTYRGYEGLYNFYNIGAYDGQNAVANGLNWAAGGSTKATTYGRPWTTPYKSIVGGAQYIAANYINKGQNTLYFQKFNVKPNDSKYLYLHQYMTNVQAPCSEGRITKTAYNNLGILADSMVFYIPVYSNMPAKACAIPASTGNPNGFLSDLGVYSGNTKLAMSATFVKPTEAGVLSNNTYSIVVAKNIASVNVKASTISKYATVSGTGTINLGNPGETTTIKVYGVAQNGTKKEYVVKITRQK